jgi:hypothetical protein
MKRTILGFVAVAILAACAGYGAAMQEQPRVFSAVSATVEPGHMAEYLATIEQSIMPFLAAQDVEVVGVFRNSIGGPSNQVILWLGYKDLAHVQAVAENSTLTDIQERTFESMRVLENHLLTPTTFSPLN